MSARCKIQFIVVYVIILALAIPKMLAAKESQNGESILETEQLLIKELKVGLRGQVLLLDVTVALFSRCNQKKSGLRIRKNDK